MAARGGGSALALPPSLSLQPHSHGRLNQTPLCKAKGGSPSFFFPSLFLGSLLTSVLEAAKAAAVKANEVRDTPRHKG